MARRYFFGLLLVIAACESSSNTGATPQTDTQAVDSQAGDTQAADTQAVDTLAGDTQASDTALPEDVASDSVTVEDTAAADTDLLTDVAGGCPADLFDLDGKPCSTEGLSCNKCTDSCQFCNIWRCEGGTWSHMEVFPDPNCGDTGDSDISGGDTEDPCALVGCSFPPMCDQGCQAPCGCCSCAEGEATCVAGAEVDVVRSCSSNGCYVESTCATGDLCVAVADVGVGCIQGFGTCVDVEAAYAFFTDDAHKACDVDTDCQVLDGHCGVGVGGCYELVNRTTTGAVLDALAGRFAGLNCTTAVCDCAPSPIGAVCQNHLCVAAP